MLSPIPWSVSNPDAGNSLDSVGIPALIGSEALHTSRPRRTEKCGNAFPNYKKKVISIELAIIAKLFSLPILNGGETRRTW